MKLHPFLPVNYHPVGNLDVMCFPEVGRAPRETYDQWDEDESDTHHANGQPQNVDAT